MASLPPLGRDHPADPLAQSFASQRIKALGGRMTRTRQSPSAWRNGASPEFGREKIGPRTVIRAPMALLGKVLSEKDFRRAGERFPLTSHRRKRADPSPLESASSFPSFDPAFASPRPVEETKVKDSGDSELVEFAAKMKGIQLTVQLFAVKALGEGHRPEAREGGTMITINRRMYVFGGRCRMMFNDIKVLDPETMKWEAHHSAPTLEGPPEPRMNHTAVPFKNQMVVYGGCDRFNDTLQFRNCFSLLHFYDTITKTWNNMKVAGVSPEPRRNHCAAVVGKHMFFYGGIDRIGKTLDDIQGVNLGTPYPETISWFTPSLSRRFRPGPLSNASLTAAYSPQLCGLSNFDIYSPPKLYDDTFTVKTSGLYLIGGLNERGEASSDVFILKPKKKSVKDDRPILAWSKVELTGTQPEPRHSHCACLSTRFIFILGGRNDSIYSQATRCELNSIALLNIESQRWDKIEILGDIPSGRWGHCMASIGSKVVLFGGMKLEKYCGTKVYVIETDPLLATELVGQWKEREALKKEEEARARRLARTKTRARTNVG